MDPNQNPILLEIFLQKNCKNFKMKDPVPEPWFTKGNENLPVVRYVYAQGFSKYCYWDNGQCCIA